MKDRIPRILFAFACLFLTFLYGFLASQNRWFPYSFMSAALTQIAVTRQDTGDLNRFHHRYPARHDLEGVKTYASAGSNGDAAVPGLILLTSFWPDQDWGPGIRLIDRGGRVLHRWNIDVPAIWPETKHLDPATGKKNVASNYVHGCHLFPNGDVLFNIEYLGMARMNAQGQVLWRLDFGMHHSIHRADDGNFWVCGMQVRNAGEDKNPFHGLTPPFAEDLAMLVSPQGKILREISVLEVLYRAGLETTLWTNQFAPPGLDVTHMNDVEPLSAAMADQYPLFKAGDLLVSMRNLNIVFVFDPDTLAIKWASPGLFTEQHDPDFIGDGWISVYDNRSDGTLENRHRGGSKVMVICPHTADLRTIYPLQPAASQHERRFSSHLGGKVQKLENGHWLITEPSAGRVFEIDKDGRTIWEWGQKRHADNMVSEVLEGTRYSLTAEQVRGWSR